MSSQNSTIASITTDYPTLSFIEDAAFFWSPADKSVHMNTERLSDESGVWSLLHEVAHGVLEHATYSSDYELLAYEVAAWEKAATLAKKYGSQISDDHIEDCLDSYRDWLYARSTCPTCKLNSLQTETNTYTCLNCACIWRVSPSRFCRAYRLKTKTPSEAVPQMVFAEKSV
jgi:hypothetical protein